MKELSFRGSERYRHLAWVPAWVLGVGLALGGACTVAGLGNGVALCWVAVLGAAFTGFGIGKARRSWTTVGAAGITICQGIGRRGRTYRWQDIRWIDIRVTQTRSGTSRAVRIALSDGRRRSLPALAYSNTDPDPLFYRHFARIIRWWEHNTDPATRFVPPDTNLSRRAPTVLGIILLVLTATTATLALTK